MSQRTFKISRTRTVVQEIDIPLEKAKEWFPDVQWDNPDVSHAGEAEDHLLSTLDGMHGVGSITLAAINRALDRSLPDIDDEWKVGEL